LAGIRAGDEETTIDGVPVKLGGDVIVGVDNKTVRKIDDILVYLQREKAVGDELQLTILRDGQEMSITAVLGARPSQQESP
jgi:S1-C subfamily serine protease